MQKNCVKIPNISYSLNKNKIVVKRYDLLNYDIGN